MSKIEELINQYCPDGVKYVPLGTVAKLSRGQVISKIHLRDNIGDYPVYSSQTANNGELGKINTYTYDGKYLTWTTDGAYAGTIFRREGKFNITNVCGLIDINKQILNFDFTFFWLSFVAKDYVYSGMGNPKLMSNVMSTILVPIPPLPIQEKIAKILDKFSLLTAELEAELEAELDLQKKRYDYYRNRILSFDSEPSSNSVQWRPLGEVGTFERGNGMSKNDFSDEGVGCIHYGQIYTKLNTFTYNTLTKVPSQLAQKLTKVETGNLVIACTSENVEDVCKSVAWLGNETIVIGGHAAVYRHKMNPKYVAYYFQTKKFAEQKRKYAKGVKVIDIKISELEKILIPVPPIEVQDFIANILDRFEALVTNLSNGLPAEIERVRKQYEYYRNKLLTFPIAEQ